MMHDMHCHLDLYEDPLTVASQTEQSGIFTLVVTNLPSAYNAALPHIRGFRYLKLAAGLHPLLSEHHSLQEKRLFQEALSQTSYVGEVGLDFSHDGIATKETQLTSFRFVLSLLKDKHKVVTVHSRRSEAVTLDLVTEFGVSPVIFHWYSGSLETLDLIVKQGHFFSVNPAMLHSRNGQRILERIPPNCLLTETDGPFVIVNSRPAVPADVSLVHTHLAQLWKLPVAQVAEQLSANLRAYLDRALAEH